MARILVVDDHKNMRLTLGLMLRRDGHEVEEAEDGNEALVRLGEDVDLVLTDLKMEPMGGLEVLRRSKQTSPTTEVIVMTAFGTIDSAVEAMRLGACDYLTKPFQEAELLVRIQKAVEKRALVKNVTALQSEFRDKYSLGAIVGNSSVIRDVISRILRAAPTDSTVLVTGENGTGKELVAKAIHANSRRATKPFVPVNCAAITEQILESELFGHVKGAFTGAMSARKGLMEEADGGTFFFDEIAEMTPALQAKLLRVLQEHEIRRVGDNKPVKIDVRLIAASNRNLEEEIAAGRFRADLFYRLNVIPIHMPSLRERSGDVPLLARHFLQKYNKKMGRALTLTDEAIDKLVAYDFPGNVRELENLIEQAVALCEGDVINDEYIFIKARASTPFASSGPHVGAAVSAREEDAGNGSSRGSTSLDALVAVAEKHAIEEALSRHDGSLDQVARDLQLSSTTLWRKMKRHSITRDRN